MKTEDKRACPSCGNKLAEVMEFCPVCALRHGLAGEGESGESHERALDPTLEQARQRYEHYELVVGIDGKPVELGRGAMGVTYKAVDVDLRCAVTLKVISEKYLGDESARRRFLREARAAASVRHPNVASVFHLGRTGQNYFYAMEFVEGETLEKIIKSSGRIELKLALEIAAQVATGLAAIHKQKLVHRDIKPSNIMVASPGDKIPSVKIIDLGLAKGAALEEDAISAISNQGIFVGTPEYASPEQFSGLGVDIRSDLYSLGVTLWVMLAGEVPFRGSFSELDFQHRHAFLPIEKLTHVPPPVIALLEILLGKNPSQRFQTPTELFQAVSKVTEALDSGRPVTTDQWRLGVDATEGRPGEPRSGIHPTLTAMSRRPFGRQLAFALAVAGLLLSWFLFSNYGELLFRQRVAGTVPMQKSIAVLPFESISPNKDDSYFADGVQDEILNNLARIAQLKVISRTSVMQYRGDNKSDLRQIADALSVATVLEGTVRRDGNRVRVSTELVDARNDHTIWADSFDRNLTDIFDIQSEIAQKVAGRLSAQLSPEERKDIEEKPTNNLQAYDLYLHAKQLINSVVLRTSTKETHSKAVRLLEEATQKDPQFALAYCMIAKVHDIFYYTRIDHTVERRSLGDAAINEALRLAPDLAESRLAEAFHLYYCYRDLEGARKQIAFAARSLSSDPDLLQLTALIDRSQGQWEKATAGLEKAATLDPLNPDILDDLACLYQDLRRYRNSERTFDRLIKLQPGQPEYSLEKAQTVFFEKADVKSVRAAYEAVPLSMRDDPHVTFYRVYFAMCARDFRAAEAILSENPNAEIGLVGGALVSRRIWALWLQLVQGNHPTMEQFGAAREQLSQKVAADRTDPYLLTSLALTDVALGRKEESIQEGRRAMEMRPLSQDAVDGPVIAQRLALIYVWAKEPNLAFEQLNILIKMPAGLVTYGNLKANPSWDPLRNDPRFDKLLAKLEPHD